MSCADTVWCKYPSLDTVWCNTDNKRGHLMVSTFVVYDRGLRKAGSWQGSDPSRSEGEAFFPCHEKSQIYLPGKSGIFIFIG